jgi:hypothetical protein
VHNDPKEAPIFRHIRRLDSRYKIKSAGFQVIF